MRYDAIIAGAGPAGLAAALELSTAGWKVLLVERSQFPRDKVCGGFIGPENRMFLERHDLAEALRRCGGEEIENVLLTSSGGGECRIPVTLSGKRSSGFGLSRRLLDDLLLQRVLRNGVDVRTETEAAILPQNAASRVRLRHRRTGNEEEVFSAVVVDTRGGQKYAGAAGRRAYLGVAALFTRPRDIEDTVMLHFIQGGHAGMNLFEDGKLNVCYLVGPQLVQESGGDMEKLFHFFIQRSPAVRRLLENQQRLTPWKGIRFAKAPAAHFYRQNIFYAGDAAVPVHPVVGGGITLALAGGSLLAGCLIRGRKRDWDYRKTGVFYQAQWKKFFSKRIRAAEWIGRLSHEKMAADLAIRALSWRENAAAGIFGSQHHLDQRVFSFA